MGGGNAHQRAVQRSAEARMASRVADIVADRITAESTPEDKTIRGRIFAFLDHGWFIGSITTVGALVGFFYTPVLAMCGFGILLAFHRAGVVRGYSTRIQVGAYLFIFLATTLAMYGANRAIKDHLPRVPTAKEIAREIVALLPKTQPAQIIQPTTNAPKVTPAQMEELKELSSFIGEPDEMSLRKEFGFPEMMDVNIRGVINNLHRWRRTGQLSHYELPSGYETLIDSRFSKVHIHRQGGGFIMDFDDTTVYFVLLPPAYSRGLAHLRKIENSSELPKPVLRTVKDFDGAVSQNATHLIEVLSGAMDKNKDYFFEYDNPNSPLFHKIDALYLDSFVPNQIGSEMQSGSSWGLARQFQRRVSLRFSPRSPSGKPHIPSNCG